MLNFIPYEDVTEVQLGPRLVCTKDVEQDFREKIKTEEDLFLDKTSKRLMMAIDHAYRIDAYAVRTPYGKSCITCLCTGGKMGLLLLHYHRKGLIPVVSYYAAGENVWQWLADQPDLNICITGRGDTVWEFDRFSPCKEKRDARLDKYIADKEDCYEISKEKEEIAYERYKAQGEKVICRIQETLPAADFRQRFACDHWALEEEENFAQYTVVNHCSVLWEDLNYRRHPFYIVGRRISDDQYEWQHDLACKNSTFLEVLRDDMMDSYFDYEKQERYPFIDLYSSWFCLLLDCDEVYPVRQYTDVVLCGVEINPANKHIEIYGKDEAIEIFHERYQQCQNG